MFLWHFYRCVICSLLWIAIFQGWQWLLKGVRLQTKEVQRGRKGKFENNERWCNVSELNNGWDVEYLVSLPSSTMMDTMWNNKNVIGNQFCYCKRHERDVLWFYQKSHILEGSEIMWKEVNCNLLQKPTFILWFVILITVSLATFWKTRNNCEIELTILRPWDL